MLRFRQKLHVRQCPMQIAIAQLNQVLGDLRGNARRHPARRRPRPSAAARGSSSRPSFRCAAIRRRTSCCGRRFSMPARASSPRSRQACARTPVVVGFPERDGGARYNALARAAPTVASARSTASSSCRTTRCSTRSATSSPATRRASSTSTARAVGLIICEDVWFPGRRAGEGGRRAGGRRRQRLAVPHAAAGSAAAKQVGARARETGLPFVYVNRVGGQDELVFDGASFVMDADGDVVQQLPGVARNDGARDARRRHAATGARRARPRLEYHVYEALVMGVRDYVGEEPLPRRAARSVRRRRFGAGARGRRRRARARRACTR